MNILAVATLDNIFKRNNLVAIGEPDKIMISQIIFEGKTEKWKQKQLSKFKQAFPKSEITVDKIMVWQYH